MQPESKAPAGAGIIELIVGILETAGIETEDHLLARAVGELSAHFNRRQTLSRHTDSYMSDPKWRAAYLAYFFPANAVKTAQLLARLHQEGFFAGGAHQKLRILDFGSGPGSAALGVSYFLRVLGWPPPDIRLIDTSQQAAEFAAASLTRLQLVSSVQTATRLGTEVQSYDLVLAFNVLNEMEPGEAAAVARDLLKRVDARGLLLIAEPALRETARRLIRLRDTLIAGGAALTLWPCLHCKPCPGLREDNDWCHGSEEWDRPAWVERIDREIGNRKERLNYTALLLTGNSSPNTCAEPNAPDGGSNRTTDDQLNRTKHSGLPAGDIPAQTIGWWRVVSDPLIERGKRILYLCGGTDGDRIRATLLERHVTDNNRDFTRADRYDRLMITGPLEKKGDGWRLGTENRVCLASRYLAHSPPSPDRI